VDFVVIAILGIATVRGLFRGLVREALSVGALVGACFAVVYLSDRASEWIHHLTDGEIGPSIAPWVAGIAVAVGTLFAAALLARMVRGGARAAGLGWVDHAGGAALGVAEGVLLSAILVQVASSSLGPYHPFLSGSKTLAAFEEIERVAARDDLLDVAAPPPP
jgi:membrane protein required for colicin V production